MKGNIYRVGTFLKYFISENHKRLLEDSLLSSFEYYIKGGSNKVTAQNLQKLELDYILLDLNAATIDQDPGKRLTARYEEMLEFLLYEKVELNWLW